MQIQILKLIYSNINILFELKLRMSHTATYFRTLVCYQLNIKRCCQNRIATPVLMLYKGWYLYLLFEFKV